MQLLNKLDIPSLVQNQVRDIFIYKNTLNQEDSSLPFYPDGYPGIVYLEADSATVNLHRVEKLVSPLFLYGQATHPVKLIIKRAYLMIVYRMEPDICHHILNAKSAEINDDCIDLSQTHCAENGALIDKLKEQNMEGKISLMNRFIHCLTQDYKTDNYAQIDKAIRLILKHKGIIPMSEVRKHIFMSERTFQRHFREVVGVTPKQWSTIIRFHTSKNRLSNKDSKEFIDVVNDFGFTDQSHFIKFFKRYTGKTPVDYLNFITSTAHQPLD